MKIILPFLFESLKQQTLTRAGIKVIVPGDCKFISASIASVVNKQISDTTLKRIYGFTYSKFLPSLYTLNVLAEYCGYAGWDDFCKHQQGGASSVDKSPKADDKANIIDQAFLISQKTFKSLTNRSVVPFNLTIKRDFVRDQLELFSNMEQTATILSAPAGYGKTISLCHWVEERLNTVDKGNGDVLLFLSSKVLSLHPNAGSLNDWLKALMGLNSHETGLAGLLDDDGFRNRKFYLIIDGFDKEKFKPGDFELLTDILLDIIALYGNHSNFKVILTLRSANWISIRNRLIIESGLDRWFLGFMQDSEQEANMLMFSAEEIKALSANINPSQEAVKTINPEVVSLFSYPLFFQYYYQKNQGRFCLNHLDFFGIYDVISSFFLDKIYNARLATEKVLVIRALLEHGTVKDGKFIVNKLKVYEEFKHLWNAYNELVSIGFIREVNRSSEGGYFKNIEFAHTRLLAYCMAHNLVYDNNELYDERLIEMIGSKIDASYRIPVLKWCIFNAIKVRQLDIIKHITKISLSAVEKTYLLKFLINLIQHKYMPLKMTEPGKYTFCNEDQELFHYFFGLEFISPEYEEVLKQLATIDLEDVSKVCVQTCLGIIGIVQLNSSTIENCIVELRNIPEQVLQSFPINPLYCIETIYTFFKHGVVRKEALAQITRFYFNPPAKVRAISNLYSHQVLNLLALSTLGIGNNKHKLLRFIKVLQQRYVKDSGSTNSFEFFLNVTKADSLLVLGRTDEAISVYDDLMNAYISKKNSYTPYMSVCLDLVTAKIMSLKGNETEAQLIIEKVMQASVKYKFHYIEAYIIAGYLATPGLDTTSEFYKDIYYRFIKLVRSGGLNMKSFLFKYDRQPSVI